MTTLCSLVEQIEGDLMPDKQTVARIDARIEEIRSRVRELEENDPIATPPPSTSDDEPAYDTQLPGAGADGR